MPAQQSSMVMSGARTHSPGMELPSQPLAATISWAVSARTGSASLSICSAYSSASSAVGGPKVEPSYRPIRKEKGMLGSFR